MSQQEPGMQSLLVIALRQFASMVEAKMRAGATEQDALAELDTDGTLPKLVADLGYSERAATARSATVTEGLTNRIATLQAAQDGWAPIMARAAEALEREATAREQANILEARRLELEEKKSQRWWSALGAVFSDPKTKTALFWAVAIFLGWAARGCNVDVAGVAATVQGLVP